MPICNKCKQDLPVEAFHKRVYKSGRIATQPTCKECKKAISKTRYLLNKDHILNVNREYRKNNPHKMKQYRKAWLSKNPKIKAFYTALYRARKDGNISPLINVKELVDIRAVYLNCPEGYVVDHIVPRHGRDGSKGLHIACNLQYLTPKENCIKSNKLSV